MKTFFQQLYVQARKMGKNSLVFWMLILSFLFTCISFAIPFIVLYPEIAQKTAVPLHYNIHFGVDLFGAWWRIFIPSIIGAVVICVNSFFGALYWNRKRILSYYALYSLPLITLFLILSSLFMTLLNLTYD